MKAKVLGLLGAMAIVLPLHVHAADTLRATAGFLDADGKSIGTADLVQTPNGVLVTVEVRGLAAGVHAVHVHAVGACDAAGGFESAGGHFAPGGTMHGYMSWGGPHAGDMPNQAVGADGVLRVSLFNPNVTLGEGTASLFDADGSAIVIHAGADDYASQPSGNAGGRAACAVIEKTP